MGLRAQNVACLSEFNCSCAASVPDLRLHCASRFHFKALVHVGFSPLRCLARCHGFPHCPASSDPTLQVRIKSLGPSLFVTLIVGSRTLVVHRPRRQCFPCFARVCARAHARTRNSCSCPAAQLPLMLRFRASLCPFARYSFAGFSTDRRAFLARVRVRGLLQRLGRSGSSFHSPCPSLASSQCQ